MDVIIMGCGRVGSTLALLLEAQHHDVAVIDQSAAAFRRLGSGFEGRRVRGIGFDRDTLREAGIERASAFAAVSSGDNSNILAARVARETYGVEHVVARIYDPRRAAIYQRLGIPTVATVQWTVDRVLEHLAGGLPPAPTVPAGAVRLTEVEVHPGWRRRLVSAVEGDADTRVAYLSRAGRTVLPRPDTRLHEADVVHLAHPSDDIDRVRRLLARPPAP